MTVQPTGVEPSGGGVGNTLTQSPRSLAPALRWWLAAYRTETIVFLISFFVLASFSSFRFLRQSEAPHFVYQAKAWLDGRLDIDPSVLPNLEDWACVRQVAGIKVRCEGQILPTDHWYVSFPPFPAMLMLPFVAIQGYQLNDTSMGVIIAALALSLFYALLRNLTKTGEVERPNWELLLLTATLGFGTVFFYCAIRGEVWFFAEVLGVALTCIYIRNSINARRPLLAGFVFSMAVLTRTPLLFTGIFFVLEAICPGPNRGEQWRQFFKTPQPALKKIGLFAVAAAPLAILVAAYNQYRFGHISEFGHRFLFNNRVNADIDQYGLFHWVYLPRNLQAAFTLLPSIDSGRIAYSPYGMSLLLTLPLVVFLFWPRRSSRLNIPLWAAVALCALPGLLYQNTGYMQFGFRFSLDYTPYLLLLFAVGGWAMRTIPVSIALAIGFLVNFWGAVAFRGYTELMRHW